MDIGLFFIFHFHFRLSVLSLARSSYYYTQCLYVWTLHAGKSIVVVALLLLLLCLFATTTTTTAGATLCISAGLFSLGKHTGESPPVMVCTEDS